MRMPDIFSGGRRRDLSIIAALSIAQAGAAAAAAMATRAVFGDLHAGGDIAYVAIAVLAASGLAIGAARIAFALIGERIGQTYALEVREALFWHATGLTASDIASRRQGYVALRFVGDLNAFRMWIAKGAPHLISAPIQIIAMIGVLFVMAPGFGAAALAIFGIAAGIIWLGREGLERAHKTLRSRRAAIAADMTDLMPVAPELAQFGRKKFEIRRLREKTGAMIKAALRQTRSAESLYALSDIAAAIAAALVLLIAQVQGVATGSVAGAFAALGIGAAALRDLAHSADHFGAYAIAKEKCEAALSRKRARPRTGTRALPEGALSLSIKELETPFGAPVSIELAAGASGLLSEKHRASVDFVISTLCGRERCAEGAVKIGGVDLQDVAPDVLRKRVGLITVSPLIVKGSVRRNLTLGLAKRPSDEDLTALLADLKANERLLSLDQALLAGGPELSPIDRLHISMMRVALNRPGLVLIQQQVLTMEGDISGHLNLVEATCFTA